MQLAKAISPNSAIFIEKKRKENRLWRNSGFLPGKKCITCFTELLHRELPESKLNQQDHENIIDKAKFSV